MSGMAKEKRDFLPLPCRLSGVFGESVLVSYLFLIHGGETIEGNAQDTLALGQIGVLRINQRAALVLHDGLALHKVFCQFQP